MPSTLSRIGRRIGIAALSVVGAAGLLELVAAIRVHRLRDERSDLGDRLFTETRGAGEPIVFIAGLPATTRFWQGAFDPLAAGHWLIFVDALGFGRSPFPDVDYTLDDQLGALRRTLVAVGATRHVTFVAHSFGTVLAANYAALYPDEVDRLFLLGTPVFDDEPQARAHIREMSSMSGLFVLNPLLAREACKFHELLASPALARLVSASMPDTPPEVTFVHGREDRVTSLGRVQTLAAAIGAEVLITNDEHLTYPQRSAGRIRAAILLSGPDAIQSTDDQP